MIKAGAKILSFVLIGCLFACAQGSTTQAISGGSETGNPAALRVVRGTVAPSFSALSISAVGNNCAAGQVVAIDSNETSYEFAIEEDCSFELLLPIDHAYRILFLVEDEITAVMSFNNGPGQSNSPVMILSFGDEINLGVVTAVGGVATPENEPSLQNDQDGDGINDFDDLDDDNDGIADIDEVDCDLDGIIDDYDSINSDCEQDPESDAGLIVSVSPPAGQGLDGVTNPVLIGSVIEIRVDCILVNRTINDSTVRIFSDTHAVALDFTWIPGGGVFTCYPIQDLNKGTVYTVVVEGIECRDGSIVETRSWSWQTETG